MRGLMVIIAGTALSAAAEFKVYVAAEAVAGGSGERRSPYQTFVQARDGIRAARKAGALKPGEPVTVSVGAGVYRLDETFELAAEDGGTDEAPVVYRAAKRGAARVHGGATLDPAAFAPLGKRIVGKETAMAARIKRANAVQR